MDNVIRLSKFVKNLGIVTTVLFLIIILVTFVTGNMGVAICFMPFVFLGIALILAYKKQIIVVNEDEIVFSYLVKKTQHIKYNDIRCILMIPLNGRTDVILIDKMYNRLVTLEQVYVNYDILYDTLIKHEIDLVDFGELVEQNKDVSKYVPALNWIEKNFYKSICNENTTIKNMSKTIEKEKRKKTKQFLKALGWILIIADAVAFFIGGKTMLVIFIMVLMITYAVYIKYYPYIFIEVTTKKGQELAYQLPFMGAAIAMLLSLNTSKLFNYEFGNYMKITAIITALLALPFIIKSLKTDVPQKFGRKLSVVFAAFIIAFTISFPINFLFTFDGATHEIAIVTDKKISSGKTRDRELYVSCNGKREIYTVSNSEYENTSIGDSKRICRRKSALGLEYSTIHD